MACGGLQWRGLAWGGLCPRGPWLWAHPQAARVRSLGLVLPCVRSLKLFPCAVLPCARSLKSFPFQAVHGLAVSPARVGRGGGRAAAHVHCCMAHEHRAQVRVAVVWAQPPAAAKGRCVLHDCMFEVASERIRAWLGCCCAHATAKGRCVRHDCAF